MSPGKRLLLVAPAVTAFVWWLLRHGPDVDAWSHGRDGGQGRPGVDPAEGSADAPGSAGAGNVP